MGNFMFGLQLMLIGMVTVFAILLIVIYGSRFLVYVINKFVPAEVVAAKEKSDNVPMDVLQQAVSQITGGKGHIVNVTKLS
ncbi:MAG: OadG family protein [Bacteroidales bacterium]|nr:OadG family protein [Bacteroidales bacterium]